MANDDYAVIVGIQDYPGLDDPANGQPHLAGPVNDANAFYQWIISPEGGDVPDDNIHIKKVLSSNQGNAPLSVLTARPVANDVENAIKEIRLISDENVRKGKGLRIGRRLYIFMAGHGIAPRIFIEDNNEWEAALLMANVERTNLGATYHIPGAYIAKWFWQNECFDEVFLFMDCCRESELVGSINYFLPKNASNSANGKRCIILGTKWSRTSREKAMPDENGVVRGVFTKTLLRGLSGDAAVTDLTVDDFNGKITAFSLSNYIHDNMKNYFSEDELADMNMELSPLDPDVHCVPSSDRGEILIKSVPLKRFPVIFHFPVGTGGNLKLRFNDKETPGLPAIQVLNPPCEIQVDLPRGRYIAAVAINNNVNDQEVTVNGFGDPGTNGITHVHF